MWSEHSRRIVRQNGAVLALVVAILGCVIFAAPRPLIFAYEDVVLAFAPSAARAVQFGDWHFDATSSRLYDIQRAEKMYRKAAEMDASHQGVQHQLARVDFLHANFSTALTHIDREIELYGDENPNAYYIRALILGYQGKFVQAAADYETYFNKTSANWAAINDYSWVLLKANLPEAALAALEWGLEKWPDNPWLLHNKVIALYELKRYEEAAATAEAAVAAVEVVTEADWLIAYPGNDPRSAAQGLESFREAVRKNQTKVTEAMTEI